MHSENGLFLEPMQLPAEFCKVLLNQFSKPQSLVLDMFGGTRAFAYTEVLLDCNVHVLELVASTFQEIITQLTTLMSQSHIPSSRVIPKPIDPEHSANKNSSSAQPPSSTGTTIQKTQNAVSIIVAASLSATSNTAPMVEFVLPFNE